MGSMIKGACGLKVALFIKTGETRESRPVFAKSFDGRGSANG